MKTQVLKCDLCKRSKAMPEHILCKTCADGISRVMLVAKWELERGYDVRRNQEQMDMLVAYLKVTQGMAVDWVLTQGKGVGK
jgi:hypothetical protein